MIDDDKIVKAASELCDYGSIHDSKYRIEGFKKCAKWMQEEFLKDLWNSASEEPKSNSNILIKIKAYKLVLYPEGKKENICGYFYKVIEYDKKDKWKLTELEKEYQCNLKVIEWLYIDDLLPKKGGK